MPLLGTATFILGNVENILGTNALKGDFMIETSAEIQPVSIAKKKKYKSNTAISAYDFLQRFPNDKTTMEYLEIQPKSLRRLRMPPPHIYFGIRFTATV